jgi:hypothetical protein
MTIKLKDLSAQANLRSKSSNSGRSQKIIDRV